MKNNNLELMEKIEGLCKTIITNIGVEKITDDKILFPILLINEETKEVKILCDDNTKDIIEPLRKEIESNETLTIKISEGRSNDYASPKILENIPPIEDGLMPCIKNLYSSNTCIFDGLIVKENTNGNIFPLLIKDDIFSEIIYFIDKETQGPIESKRSFMYAQGAAQDISQVCNTLILLDNVMNRSSIINEGINGKLNYPILILDINTYDMKLIYREENKEINNLKEKYNKCMYIDFIKQKIESEMEQKIFSLIVSEKIQYITKYNGLGLNEFYGERQLIFDDENLDNKRIDTELSNKINNLGSLLLRIIECSNLTVTEYGILKIRNIDSVNLPIVLINRDEGKMKVYYDAEGEIKELENDAKGIDCIEFIKTEKPDLSKLSYDKDIKPDNIKRDEMYISNIFISSGKIFKDNNDKENSKLYILINDSLYDEPLHIIRDNK